jgi:hypothetical protein
MISGVHGRSTSPVGLLAALCALAPAVACSNSARTLTCAGTVASVCATPGSCVSTWDEAQTDTSFCPGATDSSPSRVDCGPYHALTVKVSDGARTYYYDASVDGGSSGSSGTLIAIVTAHAASATTTCDAGPATGFTLPVCSGMGSEPLSQCFDGGLDATAD